MKKYLLKARIALFSISIKEQLLAHNRYQRNVYRRNNVLNVQFSDTNCNCFASFFVYFYVDVIPWKNEWKEKMSNLKSNFNNFVVPNM